MKRSTFLGATVASLEAQVGSLGKVFGSGRCKRGRATEGRVCLRGAGG